MLFTPKSRSKAVSECKRHSEDSVSFVMDICRTIPYVCIICIKIIRFSKAISKALSHEHCILPTHEIFLLLVSVKCSIFSNKITPDEWILQEI